MSTNSIYRVLCMQVPVFWEAIKYCCVQADEVPEDARQHYFMSLLQDLLSDKAQCFIVLDHERVLRAMAITRIISDKTSGQKELEIQCLYSMMHIPDEDLQRYWGFIGEFGRKESCKAVVFNTRNERIMDIAEMLGCQERLRRYSLDFRR
ncbi:hypothetical protein KO465_04760 [Candidatus Micrarchaeota archaeon]|nr:hypothetical protein [Candidatus Micrarchaeota archaeon]